MPVLGPVLYPVMDRRAVYSQGYYPATLTFLNEKMEPVRTIENVDSTKAYYAAGAQGYYYLGESVDQRVPITALGQQIRFSRTYYDALGKEMGQENYDSGHHLVGEPAETALGVTQYVGNLCRVDGTILAKWNTQGHRIGEELGRFQLGILFDEEGNAYGFDFGDDGYLRVTAFDQSGEPLALPVRYHGYARGQSGIGPNYYLNECYLPTFRGEEGLYPYQDENGLYGYKDDKGAWVIKPQFAYAAPFYGNLTIVNSGNSLKNTLIDRSGKKIEGISNAELIPGYGYVAQVSDSASGTNAVKSRVYRPDGSLWVSSTRTLGRSGAADGVLSIQYERNRQDLYKFYAFYELNLKTGVVSAGEEIVQQGKLLRSDRAIGTTDGRVLVCVNENDRLATIFALRQKVLYRKFVDSGTYFSISYWDEYNRDGTKIVADAFYCREVGNYLWVEKDSERGYVDYNGNWVYRENWDTGMMYLDVKTQDWYYTALKYIWDEGLLEGTSRTTFSPYANIIRSELITMLYRQAGRPEAKLPANYYFTDVYASNYAVVWGYENDIIHGNGDGTFGPKDNITREQAVAVLYRFTQWSKMETKDAMSLDAFADQNQVSDYAKESMAWAVANGVITGKPGKRLDPHGNLTRAEMSTMVYRLCGQNELSGMLQTGHDPQ